MSKPSDRRKKKKFRKTPGGKTKRVFFKKHSSRKQCALCERVLSGTLTREREAKASLTEKRPSAPFAGSLCNVCRARVFEEALKIKEGVKKASDLELRLKPYIETALKKIEG